MVNEKLLRSNITVLAAYPEAFKDPAKPTAAELNNQFVYGTKEGAMVFNISCAIADDGYTANKTDSETDDSRTICTVGQQQNPTFVQYEVSFDGFRDNNVTDASTYNMFLDLFKAPDVPFWIISRVGKNNTEPFAIGDDIKMFGVNTDNPIDIVDSNAMMKLGARFKATGELNFNYRIAA